MQGRHYPSDLTDDQWQVVNASGWSGGGAAADRQALDHQRTMNRERNRLKQ